MTHAPDDYALVIGINDYPNWNAGKKSLKGPVDDARRFRDWLIKDEGGGLDPQNLKLIESSDDPLGPRQYLIDDAFREIRQQSEGKARRRFYFYFSGHGHSRAGSFQQQSLCLANWSPADAGAALHLESYIKASVGCLKFSEAVFFLDCCRVRAVVPLGHQSELECGDPDMNNRSSAVLFAADQYEPALEGEVEGEIRGYFTAGLLQVLEQGTIELRDLFDRLQDIVPIIANSRDQTVRAYPSDRKIYLGPPGPKPPPPNFVAPTGTVVDICVNSNLTGANSAEDAPPPPPVGDISVHRGDVLVARGLGYIAIKLIPGAYQVRIDHAEASETHDLEVADQAIKRTFNLPLRASATLLWGTADKHEWLTDPAVDASRWDASKGGQAVFISLRPAQLGQPQDIAGSFYLDSEEDMDPHYRGLHGANTLIRLPPGMARLTYHPPDGETSILPIPMVKDWDTHVFLLVREGRPLLGTASISMRPAGAGFDPSDALIDAYERAIADLVTGGPGPDQATLDSLLWGKYRNPLFGLLGAHFLVRKLRSDAQPDDHDLERLSIVTENLGVLLGSDAPDVIALRIWKQLITKEPPSHWPTVDVPLFSVGFQAFVEATALEYGPLVREIDDVALGLDANSPWTHWRAQPRNGNTRGSYAHPTKESELFMEDADPLRTRVIERLWRGAGYSINAREVGQRAALHATRVGGGDGFHLLREAETLLSVPEWLIDYMRDALGRSERTGEPLDYANIVRRTMLPLDVLMAAKHLVEPGSMGEQAIDLNLVSVRDKDEGSGHLAAGSS